MENLGLYLMVGSMCGLFGWALLEYLKAGYDFWRQHRTSSPPTDAPPPAPSVTVPLGVTGATGATGATGSASVELPKN